MSYPLYNTREFRIEICTLIHTLRNKTDNPVAKKAAVYLEKGLNSLAQGIESNYLDDLIDLVQDAILNDDYDAVELYVNNI